MVKMLFNSKRATNLVIHGCTGNVSNIEYDYGHLSHFRESIYYQIRNRKIPISDLYFDFNYLECFL